MPEVAIGVRGKFRVEGIRKIRHSDMGQAQLSINYTSMEIPVFTIVSSLTLSCQSMKVFPSSLRSALLPRSVSFVCSIVLSQGRGSRPSKHSLAWRRFVMRSRRASIAMPVDGTQFLLSRRSVCTQESEVKDDVLSIHALKVEK